MASKYATQAEAPNRSETNKYLNASGHWTVPSGGGGGGSDERAMISDAWSSLTAYTVGKYAIDGNKLYKCIVANTNMQPSTSPLYWVETNVTSEIYESNNYSTTEKRIGTWIDGKPLYQKTINIGSLPNNSTSAQYYSIAISNFNIVWIYDAFAINSASSSFPLNCVRMSNGFFGAWIYNNQIGITVDADRSAYTGYVTLRYTKNTD